MAEPLLSMAQQFSGLPLDSLIAGPLNASANANAAMALTQTMFILNNGFNKKVTGTAPNTTTTYEPIMITMSLTRAVLTTPPASGSGTSGSGAAPTTTNVQNFTTTFNLPVLTIIPINSLGVDEVDVQFEMEVKSSTSEDSAQSSSTSQSGEGGFEAKLGWGPFSVTVHGKVSYDHKDSQTHSTHYEASNSAKYTVHVHAGQLPIPKGVNTIIQAFAESIQPIEVKAG